MPPSGRTPRRRPPASAPPTALSMRRSNSSARQPPSASLGFPIGAAGPLKPALAPAGLEVSLLHLVIGVTCAGAHGASDGGTTPRTAADCADHGPARRTDSAAAQRPLLGAVHVRATREPEHRHDHEGSHGPLHRLASYRLPPLPPEDSVPVGARPMADAMPIDGS